MKQYYFSFFITCLTFLIYQPAGLAAVDIQTTKADSIPTKKENSATRKEIRKHLRAKKKAYLKALKKEEAQGDDRRLEPFSLFSLFLVFGSLAGLMAFVFVPLSLIFAIIGLIRIKKQPHRYKGKAFAVIALLLIFVILCIWFYILTVWVP